MIRTATEKLGTHGRRCALERLVKSRSARTRTTLTCGVGPGGYQNAVALGEVSGPSSHYSQVGENGVFECWTTSLWTCKLAAVLL